MLKCDGNVTSYNLSNHEIVASGETIKPQLYMSWGDGGRTKGGEPHLRFGEIDSKIYIFGMYSISETVHNQKLILNQIEEFSLNVKKQIIFKCDDLPVRALHLIKDKKKINIYMERVLENFIILPINYLMKNA